MPKHDRTPANDHATDALMTDEIFAASIRRTSQLSGLSRSALYSAASRGEVVFHKVGKTVVCDLRTVRAYLNSTPKAVIRAA